MQTDKAAMRRVSSLKIDMRLQRKRKYPDGKKVRKKNAQDILEYDVHVVKARYDEERRSWMYTLTDWEQKELPGETEETRLG